MGKKLQFRVSAALKSVIGRDLITNDFVAIFELVKNSIDAGASKILVDFDLEKGANSCIRVIDNGKGMSFEDIKDKWLFLAYSAKKEGTEDIQTKVYAGNKGVGRFSCDRLGGKLELQTKTKKSPLVSVVKVDWGAFERSSEDLFSKIDIEYDESNGFDVPSEFEPPKSGVVIRILELRDTDSWTRNKLILLKSNLAKLINPFGGTGDKFTIQIRCDRESEADETALRNSQETDDAPQTVNGTVQNSILANLQGKTTWLEARIEADGYLYSSLHDRGELIYRVREKLDAELLPLKKSSFAANLFFLNLAAKNSFKKLMGVRSLDFGSIFLFRNGFRVFPVGEANDDYWGLNRRKTQGVSRFLGNRDLMGKVDVFGSEEHFKESSSRDKGLIDTPAARALGVCLLRSVKKLERYVVGVSWMDQLDKEFETPERMYLDGNRARIIELIGDLSSSKEVEVLGYNRDIIGILSEKAEGFEPSLSTLRKLADRIGDKALAKEVKKAGLALKRAKSLEREALALAEKEEKARQKAEQAAELARIEAEAAKSAHQEEKQRNVFLTSTGSRDKEQLENFIHQMIYFAGHNKRLIKNQLRAISSKQGSEWEKVRDAFFQLEEGIEKIISTSRYLTAANFRMISGKIEGDLIGFIHEHLTVMAPRFTSGIEIEVVAPHKEFAMEFPPIEMGILFDNLISNAKKARASKIAFKLSIESRILQIQVRDNGRGLAPDIGDPSEIFGKGFTRTNGSGLGLYFCRDQVERLGGQIIALPRDNEKGFGLLIKFVAK
jgi:signal transduction histidine kinase